jgi:hypothetical protein
MPSSTPYLVRVLGEAAPRAPLKGAPLFMGRRGMPRGMPSSTPYLVRVLGEAAPRAPLRRPAPRVPPQSFTDAHHAAPLVTETDFTSAFDHPVFDNPSPTLTSVEATGNWTEVTWCEFDEMREPLAQLLFRFRHVLDPSPLPRSHAYHGSRWHSLRAPGPPRGEEPTLPTS